MIVNRRKVTRALAWSGVKAWGTHAVSFVVLLVLARLLSPEAFGLVALANVFVIFVRIFVWQGFGDAIVHRDTLEPEHLDTAFWINLALGAGFTAAGIAGANAVALVFGEEELGPIIAWLSLTFLFGAFSTIQDAIFRRELNYRTLAIRSLAAAFIGGIVGVGMAVVGFGVWSLVGLTLAQSLTAAIVLWVASEWRPRPRVSRRHFHDLFAYGINIIGISLLNFFKNRTDNLLIGVLIGPAALGYYDIAHRVLRVTTELVSQITTSVAFPAFSRLQTEPDRLRAAFFRSIQFTAALTFPAFVGLALVAPEVIPVLYGPQWLPSIVLVQILACSGLLQAVLLYNPAVLKAGGKPQWLLRLNLVTVVLYIVGYLVAIRWGIVGVAVAYVLVSYAIAPAAIWLVSKIIHFEATAYFRAIKPALLGTIAMTVVLLLTRWAVGGRIGRVGELLVYIGLGVFTYFLTLWYRDSPLLSDIVGIIRSDLGSNKNVERADSP